MFDVGRGYQIANLGLEQSHICMIRSVKYQCNNKIFVFEEINNVYIPMHSHWHTYIHSKICVEFVSSTKYTSVHRLKSFTDSGNVPVAGPSTG